MQSGTGHSGTDRRKGFLGMQGQSGAGDKIKNRANTKQADAGRKETGKLSPLVSARIIPSSLQFLVKIFPMLCLTLAALWPTFTMPVGGGLHGRTSS